MGSAHAREEEAHVRHQHALSHQLAKLNVKKYNIQRRNPPSMRNWAPSEVRQYRTIHDEQKRLRRKLSSLTHVGAQHSSKRLNKAKIRAAYGLVQTNMAKALETKPSWLQGQDPVLHDMLKKYAGVRRARRRPRKHKRKKRNVKGKRRTRRRTRTTKRRRRKGRKAR